MMGVAVGMDAPVALAFIAEFNASSTRGRNVMLAQVMSTGASVVLFLVMIPIYAAGVGDSLWRCAIGLGAVPAAIVLVLRFFDTSESPLWPATYEGLDQAAEVIRKTYRVDEVVVAEQPRDDRQDRRAAVRPGAILELFTTAYGIRTSLVSILVVTQAVESYGISAYTPQVLTAMLGNRIELVLLLSAVANAFGVAGRDRRRGANSPGGPSARPEGQGAVCGTAGLARTATDGRRDHRVHFPASGRAAIRLRGRKGRALAGISP